MNKKEKASLEKQLDQIAEELLLDAYCATSNILDSLYARLLVKLRDKIDIRLPKKEEQND